MDEKGMYELFVKFHQALELCLDKIEHLEGVVDVYGNSVKELETKFYDEIYKPALESFQKMEHDRDAENFSNRWREKFAPIEGDIKAIEGDDFNVGHQLYESWSTTPEDERGDEETFVDRVLENIKGQVAALRNRLGGKVEVTADEKGEPTVKVDGEEIEEDGGESVEISESESDPEDLRKFEEELKARKGGKPAKEE